MRRKDDQGFTMLEMAIAIGIFALLMLYVSQFMTSQIRLFDTATRQNELEQKARTAMMQILDEIKLHKTTYFEEGSVDRDRGVYYLDDPTEPDVPSCLIDVNPSALPAENGIYFNQGTHSLWFREPDGSDYRDYLISDSIDSVEMTSVSAHLIKIIIIAKDERTGDSFQLLSWSRLY